jgi:hypothetical protein
MAQKCRQKAYWEADQSVKEACKTFLLSRFEPVYFQELSDQITKFKNVTIIDLIDHINTKYPPEPGVNVVEVTLSEPWDPTNPLTICFKQ